MSESDLEHALAAALRDLPEPLAPDTLLPRVMAAVRTRERRPWFTRPWSTWSPLHQVSVVTASLLVLVVAITFAAPALLTTAAVETRAHTLLGPVIDLARNAQYVLNVVTTIAAAVGAVWQRLCGPLVLYAAVVVVLLGGVIGMLGTALHHFTQQRALTP